MGGGRASSQAFSGRGRFLPTFLHDETFQGFAPHLLNLCGVRLPVLTPFLLRTYFRVFPHRSPTLANGLAVISPFFQKTYFHISLPLFRISTFFINRRTSLPLGRRILPFRNPPLSPFANGEFDLSLALPSPASETHRYHRLLTVPTPFRNPPLSPFTNGAASPWRVFPWPISSSSFVLRSSFFVLRSVFFRAPSWQISSSSFFVLHFSFFVLRSMSFRAPPWPISSSSFFVLHFSFFVLRSMSFRGQFLLLHSSFFIFPSSFFVPCLSVPFLLSLPCPLPTTH